MAIRGKSLWEQKAERLEALNSRRVTNYAYRTKKSYHFHTESANVSMQDGWAIIVFRSMSLIEIPDNWIEKRVPRKRYVAEVEGSSIIVLHSDNLEVLEKIKTEVAKQIYKDSDSLNFIIFNKFFVSEVRLWTSE